MRIAISLVFSLNLLLIPILGSDVIKNPGKPISTNHGRAVTAKKAMTITDENKDYYFKKPYNVKIAPNGSIFVMDKDQLLKFTPEGKFVKNLFKKGQGPNELVYVSNYLILADNSAIIHNIAPNKILHFDAKNNPLSETRLPFERYIDLLHVNKDNYYFFGVSSPGKKVHQPKVIEINQQLLAVSKHDYSIKKKFALPQKSYMFKTSSGSALVKLHYLLSCHLRDNLFFFSSSHEYGIKLIDLDSKAFIREFDREYERVEVTDETKEFVLSGGFVIEGKSYKTPMPKYLDDIQSLHVANQKLLVFTSTVDKQKGVLVDIFDEKGKYIDCFFLKFPGKGLHYGLIHAKMAIANGAVYLIEKDEKDNWVISKYLVPEIA